MYPERPLDPPEAPGFTGHVTFAAYINDCTVEVEANVVEDVIDWDTATVNWSGIDITPVMHDSQFTSIERQFDENYHHIVSFDREFA